VNFKVYLQGKWTHWISGKIEFSNLMELERANAGFQNTEFPHLMGRNWGISGCQKNELINLLELKGGTSFTLVPASGPAEGSIRSISAALCLPPARGAVVHQPTASETNNFS